MIDSDDVWDFDDKPKFIQVGLNRIRLNKISRYEFYKCRVKLIPMLKIYIEGAMESCTSYTSDTTAVVKGDLAEKCVKYLDSIFKIKEIK